MSINTKQKLSLPRLTAIVFGSVIGMGIFNLAQNMGGTADVGAVAISWGIIAIGMLLLVFTFKILADRRPDLHSGIYQYASEGFGNYAGFNIAWGYWLCTAFGNVAYAVMLNDAVGAFFPPLLDHGYPTVIICSALIWSMFFVVSHGVRTAAYINLIMTIVKLATIAMIVVLLVIYFRWDTFTLDIWGKSVAPFNDQIRSIMMVALWCFIGIEGAVVMSSRARKPSDVGRAGIIGFALSWSLYFIVALLCFGIMSQPQLAQLKNPSLAYILISDCGPWVYYFVISAVIISLAGSWLAWTLICSQVPFAAAGAGIFPKLFLKTNRHNTPINGLIVSTITMQLFIILIVHARSVYLAAVEMTGMMVLPAYLFCALFLIKATFSPDRYLTPRPDSTLPSSSRLRPVPTSARLLRYRIIAIACTLFCFWMIYAGGLLMMLATSLFYLPGVYFYSLGRRDRPTGTPLFTRAERIFLTLLILSALTSLILILHSDIVF